MRHSLEAFNGAYRATGGLVAAEVGAGIGLNAQDMLNHMGFAKLYLVENNGWGASLQGHLDAIASKNKCVEVVFEASVEAAKKMADNSLDMVYIDADHSYESVRDDIAAWYPKVKSGGWLLFHDFDSIAHETGVHKAVREFANSHDIRVFEYPLQPQGEAAFIKKA